MNHVGIGFRRDLATELLEEDTTWPAFVELVPENWMKMGGHWKKVLDQAAQKYSLYTHGLSLSIGAPDAVSKIFLEKLKSFLDDYEVKVYSEHLSFSQSNNAHLYDLLPIPFREDAISHIVEKIKIVQDYLKRPIALENVSYYTQVAAELPEHQFISEIVAQSGCNLLLDVNNVYVNAFNQKYDSLKFIQSLPLDKVVYIHMAGHEQVADDLIIDTHGKPIIPEVFTLFEKTLELLPQKVPVLLERDFNIPKLQELEKEALVLESMCQKKWDHAAV